MLAKCPYVQLVSACDIRVARARAQAKRFNVPHHYPHINEMLAGEPFDFLINLTDMQEHERLNRQGLEAGKHVWSEKPIANSLAAGQALLRMAKQKGLRLWGAPITVQSPQFAFMAKQLADGKLGRVAAAHAHYGHEGPTWSAFFYEKLGGSMPDLAVYNSLVHGDTWDSSATIGLRWAWTWQRRMRPQSGDMSRTQRATFGSREPPWRQNAWPQDESCSSHQNMRYMFLRSLPQPGSRKRPGNELP